MRENISFFIREVWRDFCRRKLALAAAVVCLALLCLFLSLIYGAGLELGHLAGQLHSGAQVTVFLRETTGEQEMSGVKASIESWPGVIGVKTVSREEALQQMAAMLNQRQGALSSLKGYNPFLAYLEINVAPEKADEIAQKAGKLPSTDWVRDNREIMDRVLKLTYVMNLVRVLSTAFVGLIITIVASYLVHLGIAVRRDDIEVYRLLGAGEGFVAAPFLLEGAVLGCLGGMCAAVASLLLFPYLINWLSSALPFVAFLSGSRVAVMASPFLIIAGMIFGTLGSLVALRH